ncbi:MAG: hypothetical protein V1898_02495 [Patescibacteria group bacterium]
MSETEPRPIPIKVEKTYMSDPRVAEIFNIGSHYQMSEAERQSEEEVYLIEVGSKILMLMIDEYDRAETFVGNIENRTGFRGQTTDAYQKAKAIIQQVANQRGKTIEYEFRTYNLQMVDWANTSGSEIFRWKNKNNDRRHVFFHALADIDPERE